MLSGKSVGFGRRTFAAAFAAAMAFGAGSAFAAEDVDVRFSWKLKGEYAPFFLAKSSGAFEEAGLNVTLGEGAGSQAALGALLQGQEDIVVMPGMFAISAIQKGMPVKLVALYHPRTPVVMISHPDNPVTEPKDLEGKTLATSVGETGTSFLEPFCVINDVDCSKINTVMMDSQSRVPQFLQGQVDVVSAYLSNDLPILEKQTGEDYPILDLGKHGLAAPGMAVVTSDKLLEERPQVLSSFLAAVGEAVKQAKADPAKAAEVMKEAWPGGPDLDIIEKQVKATVDAVPSYDAKPVGWIEESEIRAALDLLESQEGFGEAKSVDAFYSNSLLQQ
ncbi:ABC transporter substrate-binding protein [Afifella pfennigii]|uniref:ABC transporter substrate-binding protein n=1 Tax=Afifella pfennigii TaxID=209897 RepID=UPI00068EC9DA|nr:ABC transporter substrate-binding protein [Afifella pfennigii]